MRAPRLRVATWIGEHRVRLWVYTIGTSGAVYVQKFRGTR